MIEASARASLQDVARKADISTVANAIKEALGDILQKVELTASEAILSTQAEVASQSDVLQVVNRIEALRTDLADLANREAMASFETLVRDALGTILSEVAGTSDRLHPDDIARRVSTLLTPVLERRSTESDSVSGGWVAQATLISAADQLHVQLEAFNDRIRAGSRSLESLADELASRERTAGEMTDQLASSVDASMARLAARLESRLDEVGQRDPSDSVGAELRELASAVRLLTERIERGDGSRRLRSTGS
jgi:polyhydroxyalkanoate synthesis regulator phasin